MESYIEKLRKSETVIEVSSLDLLAIWEILDEFEYEEDEDSCMGMSFFKARLCEDSFFHYKWKLEKLMESSANAQGEARADSATTPQDQTL